MRYTMNILKQGNLKGDYKEQINIKPNETTYINLPIIINVNNIGKTIFAILKDCSNVAKK